MALKKYTRRFTQTPHSITDHKKLSLKAKGLWTFLNSKPDDWDFSVERIGYFNKDGKDGITAGMKELEGHGFLKRVPLKDDTGKWIGHDYHLFDEPQPTDSGKSVNGKTADGKTVDGFNGSINKTILNKTYNNKKNQPVFNEIPFDEPVDLPSQVLKYLNDVRDSPRGFSNTASNLADIKTRIKEKFTMADFKKVIDYKNLKWKGDPKMEKYIRPSTLFGSKFNEYLVEAEIHVTSSDGSQNFKFNPTQKADLK